MFSIASADAVRFARFENVTQIVIGRSRGGFFSELLRRSLPHELVRRSQDIAIHLVTRDAETKPAALSRRTHFKFEPLRFLYATLAIAAALAIGELLTMLTPFPNLSMVFLVAVLLIALNFGIWPAIYARRYRLLSTIFSLLNLFILLPSLNFTNYLRW